jgi:hypothetical protein
VPVDNGVSVGRLPAAVEAAAYFVVSESLTNIAKHAQATGAAVLARVQDGTLTVQVRDDGVGGPDPTAAVSSGWPTGLPSRTARLRVQTPAGGGTLVAADIPLPTSSRPEVTWRGDARRGAYRLVGGAWTTAMPYGLVPVATVAVAMKVLGSMIDSVLAPWLAT